MMKEDQVEVIEIERDEGDLVVDLEVVIDTEIEIAGISTLLIFIAVVVSHPYNLKKYMIKTSIIGVAAFFYKNVCRL